MDPWTRKGGLSKEAPAGYCIGRNMKILVLPEILIVEEGPHEETTWLEGILSSKIRCHVTVRRSVANALSHLEDTRVPSPALIVLHHEGPKPNDLEILFHLRHNERTRLVPVVVLLGPNGEQDLTECYRFGANSCVISSPRRKGFIDRLSGIVRYWLTVDRSWDHGPRALTHCVP